MNDRLILLNPIVEGWWGPVILIASLSFLLWKEYKRPLRFRIGRIIAVTLLITAIAGLVLRPSFKMEKAHTIILLTENYERPQADSLLSVIPDARFFHLPGVIPFGNSSLIPSVNGTSIIINDIDIILGSGLPDFIVKQRDHRPIMFLPAATPAGVIDINIPQNVIQNKESVIQGTYYQENADNPTTLVLRSPGGAEDSVTWNTKGNHTFALHFTPKIPGQFIYSLTRKQARQSNTENVPVSVEKESMTRTLIIQQQPTYEVHYLKNFLAKKGHSIVLRYQLSKSTFRYEYTHHAETKIDQLTKKTVSDFDILIIDTETLQKLSQYEMQAVVDAVEDGLGILILYNEAIASGNLQKFIPWKMLPDKTDTTIIALSPGRSLSLNTVPMTFIRNELLQPVIQNKHGTLSGYRHQGFGKAGFQLLYNTYPLILKGDSVGYSKIWSPLLTKIERVNRTNHTLLITSTFPVYQDYPFQIEVITTGTKPTLFDDAIELPLAENPIIDDLWHATSWAGTPGWHTLTSDSIHDAYYVSGKAEWESLRIANQVKVLNQFGGKTIPENNVRAEYKPLSSLILYSLLLISLGVLWLTPKI